MITVALFVVVVVAVYYYGTSTFQYWASKGVKHDKPTFLLGNNTRGFLLRKSVTQLAVELYWKYPNEKVVGFYRATKPELLIRDPDIIKRILVTDFTYFYPRGLLPNKDHIEPMLKNLFFADGDLWRLLRQRLTPAFSSGKLKAMFPLIVERAERLQNKTLESARAGKPLDARELMAQYTTDFIGACGFGIDADCLNHEDSDFRKLGRKIFLDVSIRDIFKGILKELFPNTFKNVKVLTRIEGDLIALVDEILKQRNYKPCGRNDFIDLLLECKQKGLIVGESIEKVNADGTPEKATLDMDLALIAAQVFVFFAAGFETSSSATSFTLHQLAFNKDVQHKVQMDIDRILAKHDGKLSYDAIKEMKYLEWTFYEGMRMFPSLGFLLRQCARPYTIPEIDLHIDKGVKILIPLQALHNDPQYFEDPEVFRPERFDPEIFDDKNKYVYLPFGEGPRACIGARLGLMQSLAGLAAVLSKFSVVPAPDTLREPLVDAKGAIVQIVKGGLPLMFLERSPSSPSAAAV